jgi:hypothetical protein
MKDCWVVNMNGTNPMRFVVRAGLQCFAPPTPPSYLGRSVYMFAQSDTVQPFRVSTASINSASEMASPTAWGQREALRGGSQEVNES